MLLKIGQNSPAVKLLQSGLNSLGFNCGNPDGIFGKDTETQVEAFQKANNLGADGEAGENTLSYYNSKVADEFKIVEAVNALHYIPNSDAAIKLLTQAAISAGLPESWGSDPDTHWVLQKESDGWVGKPNYTYGTEIMQDSSRWHEVWDAIKAGIHSTSSTATGLGQLLIDNVHKFYPDDVNGIGDPLNEAVGFLKYIHDRYGSPAVTRGIYGKIGDYTHAVTGKTMHKGFQEGY